MVNRYFGALLCASLASAQTIQAPEGFSPDNTLMLGLSNDQINLQSLENAQKQFAKLNQFRVVTSRDSLQRDLGGILYSFASQSSDTLRPSFVLSFLDDTTSNVDVLLGQMNDPAVMRNIFEKIKLFGDTLRSASVDYQVPYTTTVFVEPNVWTRMLQAKFHFEKDPITRQPDLTYGNILSAGALVRNDVLGLGPEFDFLNLYDNTVADLSRALIHAVKNFFPREATVPGSHTYVGIPLNFWAAYAKGCGKVGALKVINQKVRNNPLVTQGEEGIHTWEEEDIKIAAYANVHFFRRIFDSSLTGGAKIGDPSLSKPDFYGMQRSPVDAGFTLYLDSLNPMIQKINSDKPVGMDWNKNNQSGALAGNFPAHGKPTFYWNQSQWDKWLEFSQLFSQGMATPLIALRMPVGHLALPNKIFAWEDTFYDWLFSVDATKGGFCLSADGQRRDGECAWTPNNLQKFKQAGFVGIWAGRDGWPDLTTHYGTMQRNYFLGASLGDTLERNAYFKELASPAYQLADSALSKAGDGGLFVSTLSQADRSLSPIANTFSEVDFNKYSGNCSAPSTPQLGVVELRGGKQIGGKESAIFELSNTEQVQTPEIVKKQAISTFATLADGSQRYLGSSAEDGIAISEYYKNEPGVKLHINLRYPSILDLENGKVLEEKLLPLSYRWYIFDTQGQFVNSQTGVISPAELKNYIIPDTAGGSAAGQVDLVGYFNMRSDKGRKIATGAYLWKGYIDEQKASVFTGNVDYAGNKAYETVTSENQVIKQTFGVVRK